MAGAGRGRNKDIGGRNTRQYPQKKNKNELRREDLGATSAKKEWEYTQLKWDLSGKTLGGGAGLLAGLVLECLSVYLKH